MTYEPAAARYDAMAYRSCGRSGLRLPVLSLGLWHNFGDTTPMATQRAIVHTAFDLGITHFDLANNYGPPYGSAEVNFGRILREDLAAHRDELIISSKAGWDMWPGPYGQGGGSRKYVLASLDQSLRAGRRRLLRHLLLAPLRRRHAARGDDGRAGDGRPRRARRCTSGISSYSARQDPRGGRAPARGGRAAPHPPAVATTCSTAGWSPTCSTRSRRSAPG